MNIAERNAIIKTAFQMTMGEGKTIVQKPVTIGVYHTASFDPRKASIHPRFLTRHIGIFGATGTGKTTTAASIVSRLSCPVIVLDAKGDLGCLGDVKAPWDGCQMSVSDLGADLLQRALDLSPAQAGVLEIALAWAEDTGQPCHNLTDLNCILTAMVEADLTDYGLVSTASVAAVQRSILRLRRAAPWAFGKGSFDPRDCSGRTVIHAPDLAAVPGLYAAFASHLLETVYRGLGEVGDAGAAGLAIMVDEAHLLFQDAPPAVTRRLEQIVRLIRSKGVCLIFVSQSPADLPPAILGQLATRIQHGMRAATPGQQAAVRAAAETMPGTVTQSDILGLGMGQALVSTPDADGAPLPAVKVQVLRGNLPAGRIFSDVPPPRERSISNPPEDTKMQWRMKDGKVVIRFAPIMSPPLASVSLTRSTLPPVDPLVPWPTPRDRMAQARYQADDMVGKIVKDTEMGIEYIDAAVRLDDGSKMYHHVFVRKPLPWYIWTMVAAALVCLGTML